MCRWLAYSGLSIPLETFVSIVQPGQDVLEAFHPQQP